MNQISKLPFGEKIIRGWRESRRKLIPRMCFGVRLVLGMRGGLRMGEVGCVEFEGGMRGLANVYFELVLCGSVCTVYLVLKKPRRSFGLISARYTQIYRRWVG